MYTRKIPYCVLGYDSPISLLMCFGSIGIFVLFCVVNGHWGKIAHCHLANPVTSWGHGTGQVTHSCTSRPFDWMISSTGVGTLNGATPGGNAFIQSKSRAGWMGGGSREGGGLECDDTKETNSPAGEHTSPSERVSFGQHQHSTVLCSHNPEGNQKE